MEKIKAAIAWFNAVPGRKRAIAAVAGAASAVLRIYGHSDVAHYTEAVNDILQNQVIPGADLTAVAFAVIGLIDAKRKGNL